jgi:hypothetical protein
MATLFIHVGYPKTATTTFQKHVFPNHQEIDYLGKFIPSFQYRDTTLASEIDKLMTWNDARYAGVELLRNLMNEYRQQCRKKVLLISSESFLHVTATDMGLVAQRIKSAFGPCKIIITIREQIDIIKSFYGLHGQFGQYLFLCKDQAEKIKVPLRIGDWLNYSLRNYNKNFLSTLHYGEIIRYYCRLFGKQNVGIFLYEEFCQNKMEYFRKFCDYLRIDHQTAIKLVAGKHELRNLSTRDLFYFSIFSRIFPRSKFEPWVLGRSGAKIRSIHIDPEMEERIRSLYRDGNRALMSEQALPLDAFNYCV